MPFVNRRFTNGVAFLSNMVYKSIRGGTSGPKDGASPYETFVEYSYPPPPPGGIKAARIIFLAVVGAIGIDRTMILILATVVFVRGKNCCFWSHLASSRRKADIFCTNNQTPSNCFEYSLISNNPNRWGGGVTASCLVSFRSAFKLLCYFAACRKSLLPDGANCTVTCCKGDMCNQLSSEQAPTKPSTAEPVTKGTVVLELN